MLLPAMIASLALSLPLKEPGAARAPSLLALREPTAELGLRGALLLPAATAATSPPTVTTASVLPQEPGATPEQPRRPIGESAALALPLQDPAAAARALPMPELRRADLARWREHVRPSARESAYESIPWIPTFAEGMRRADAEQKPLLFWAMNGHPLGCT